MILNMEHWHFGYEQIVSDCRAGDDGSPKTVLLLCNADVDAMASARILSFMLRSDGVNYQLLPCTNYTLLTKTLQDVQDISAVVLLNFGAARNLTRLFDELLPNSVKVYVMDCRKPVHLANIYAGENVVVFLDGMQQDLPSDGDNLSGGESTSASENDDDDSEEDSDDDDSGIEDSDNDDEDEEEADFDDVIGQDIPKIQNAQQDPAYDGGDETEEEGEEQEEKGTASPQRQRDDADDAEDSNERSPKRQKTDDIDGTTDIEDVDSPNSTEQKLDPRELHRQRRDRLRTYYSTGSFYGSPAAYIAYRLAAQLRFGDQGDLLWLACVGVTDAYLHARLDFSGYTELTQDLKGYCFRLFPNDMYERVSNTVYAEDLAGGGANGDRTKITFSDNGRIVSQNDYRFFLLRYSSLLESMVDSDYISTKLQVWTKKGMQKLQELLAKMGYPLEECKQPFAFMKPSLRRRLQEKLAENAQVRCFANYGPGHVKL
jgi:cell division control protein 45